MRLRATGWMPVLLWVAAAGCASNADIVVERRNMHNHASLAQLYYDKGRYSQALDQAHKALAVDETYVKALCILGYVELQAGRMASRPDLRIEHFRRSEEAFVGAVQNGSETNSYVYKAYFGMGLLYVQWAKAVEDLLEGDGGDEADGAEDLPGEEELWSE